MAKLSISPEAKKDLHEIKEYISVELDNPTAAVKTISRIMKAMRTLIDFPDSGAPLSSKIDVPNNYRTLMCNSYLVFYRHEGGIVNIIRVLYGRRDYIKILFGDALEDTVQ